MILLLRRLRLLTFVFAFVQLVLPGALRVIDAMQAADSRSSAAHIEETSGQHCRAAHTDDCMVCRHLATSSTRGQTSDPFILERATSQPLASHDGLPRSVADRGFNSRAPPANLI